ncbi:MAG: glycosyltransferase [Thermoanaerobaculaceae bacterium]
MDQALREHTPEARSTASPEVSVILVNYNGRHHLQRCLPALAATKGVSFETILVDNGSQDDSVPWVREHYPWVRVLSLRQNLGFGQANHKGIEMAQGRYFALLNTDTVVEPSWLAPLIKALEAEPQAVAACATLRLLHHPDLYNALGGGMSRLGYGFDRAFGYPYEDHSPSRVEEVIFPTAAAALFRKEDFLTLGGFDPSFFMYHEDVDFGLRAWLCGKKVLLCRDSVVFHAFGGSTAPASQEAFRYRLGNRHLLRTNLKCMEIRELAWTLFTLGKSWLRMRAFGLMLDVFWWNLRHLPGTIKARFHLAKRRVRTFRELRRMGLVEEAPFPPERPSLPISVREEELLISPLLLPGKDSARGRLAFGWNPQNQPEGAISRFTRRKAGFRLRLCPNAQGELVLRLRRAVPGAPPCSATVSVNGRKTTFSVAGEEFASVKVPAKADDSGFLRVTLEAPELIPHKLLKNWDFTPKALEVAEVRFLAPAREAPKAQKPSLIIPTFNRWETLHLTLQALQNQRVQPYEVVVVDDGSTDGTWEKLQNWRRENRTPWELVLVHQENRGPAAARNHGLRHARGNLVVFIGDDTIPEPDFLQFHLQAHAELRGPCAVVGLTLWDRQRMKVTPFLDYVNLAGDQFAYGLFEDGDDLPFTCFYTSNVSLPREVLGDNPFYEGFRYAAWEDAELGFRLSLKGLRIVFCAKAQTRHVHPLTLGAFLRRQEKVGETLSTLLQLHPELCHDPAIPQWRRHLLVRAFWPLWPMLAPLAHGLDSLGLRLPKALYRGLLLWAFGKGRRKTEGSEH